MDAAGKMEFVRFALHRMALHTHPFLASILSLEEDRSAARHMGTAFRVAAKGQPLIVTSAHVVEAARERGLSLAVSAVRGGPAFELQDEPSRLDQQLDVVAYDPPPRYPIQALRFWPSEKADERDDLLDTDVLVIHGFPAIRHRSDSPGGMSILRSLPYAVMRRTEDLPEDLSPSQFAVDYDAASMEGLDHSVIERVDPDGLSGSPVWRIGASGRTVEEWTPELSALVGVVTHWRPDHKILVATKWSSAAATLGLK